MSRQTSFKRNDRWTTAETNTPRSAWQATIMYSVCTRLKQLKSHSPPALRAHFLTALCSSWLDKQVSRIAHYRMTAGSSSTSPFFISRDGFISALSQWGSAIARFKWGGLIFMVSRCILPHTSRVERSTPVAPCVCGVFMLLWFPRGFLPVICFSSYVEFLCSYSFLGVSVLYSFFFCVEFSCSHGFIVGFLTVLWFPSHLAFSCSYGP